MGSLEELKKYVKLIEDICNENDLECCINIHHTNVLGTYTSLNFDCEI